MKSTNKVVPGCAIHHPGFKVVNYRNALKFYIDGLGFRKYVEWRIGEGENDMAVMLDVGNGTFIEMFGGGSVDADSNNHITHFALSTDDCDAAYQRALSFGAQPVYEPRDSTIGEVGQHVTVRWAYVRAPEGEVIELCQYK
jgi:catechol 2,3-dioxygenase-like lactoylglutathione lyase family enzyme